MQNLKRMLVLFLLPTTAHVADNSCHRNVDAFVRRIFKEAKYSMDTNDLMTLTDMRSSCTSTQQDRVYFSAYLRTHIDVSSLKSGQQLTFTDVVTNQGGAYSPGSGEFKAPRDGGYSISWEFLVFPGASITLELQVNKQLFAHGIAYGADSRYQISSKSTIINLKKGDKVRVVFFGGQGLLHGTHRYTGFSGFSL